MESSLLATLTSRLEASRQELLDLGLRNPLLNFRLSKAQGVAIVREESAQVLEILVRQGKTMYFSAAPELPKKKEKTEASLAEQAAIATDELPPLEAYFSENPPLELLLTEAEQQALLTDNKLQTAEPLARLETRLLNTYYTARTSLGKYLEYTSLRKLK